jgi:hypothetical protein
MILSLRLKNHVPLLLYREQRFRRIARSPASAPRHGRFLVEIFTRLSLRARGGLAATFDFAFALGFEGGLRLVRFVGVLSFAKSCSSRKVMRWDCASQVA